MDYQSGSKTTALQSFALIQAKLNATGLKAEPHAVFKEIDMSSFLGQSEPQVFACPKCGEMINTSMAQCAYCNAPVDRRRAASAVNAQATITSAFNYANSLMLAARGMVFLLVASFFPLVGIISATVLSTGIFSFPILVLIWFWKYQWSLQGIDKNHEDLKQSRSRVLKASIIYGVTIIAWPVSLVIIARVMALLGVS
jgi:hypothetical protein